MKSRESQRLRRYAKLPKAVVQRRIIKRIEHKIYCEKEYEDGNTDIRRTYYLTYRADMKGTYLIKSEIELIRNLLAQPQGWRSYKKIYGRSSWCGNQDELNEYKWLFNEDFNENHLFIIGTKSKLEINGSKEYLTLFQYTTIA